jgi:U3 small nucleolar RNA-associated protein 20
VSLLARDLQEEFYPSFRVIFEEVIKLIDPSSPEVLEAIFSTFSYLFKFIHKQMLLDLNNVMR